MTEMLLSELPSACNPRAASCRAMPCTTSGYSTRYVAWRSVHAQSVCLGWSNVRLVSILVVSCPPPPSHTQSQGLNSGFKDDEDDDGVYTKAFRQENQGVRLRCVFAMLLLYRDVMCVLFVWKGVHKHSYRQKNVAHNFSSFSLSTASKAATRSESTSRTAKSRRASPSPTNTGTTISDFVSSSHAM